MLTGRQAWWKIAVLHGKQAISSDKIAVLHGKQAISCDKIAVLHGKQAISSGDLNCAL